MATEQPGFGGLRVAAFESRRSGDMRKLIEKFDGRPQISPSMREAPLEESPQAIDFAHRLVTGVVDVAIFMTGVGFEHLLKLVGRRLDAQRYLDALSDIVTIARGPKVVRAMADVKLQPTYQVPEPNTWREVLSVVDQQAPVVNLQVGLQEYGRSNASLIAGLEARGAAVLPIPVYRWELPEDPEPLRETARQVAAGEIDVLLFTSANQVHNLLEVAGQLGCGDEFRHQARHTVIGSVGPTTSSALRELGLPVDVEASPPRMGTLVRATAAASQTLRSRKQRIDERFSSPGSDPQDARAPWYDSPFLRACRREPTDVTPVWLMRQAGRYMAEYREVRARTTFLDLCKNPQLCSEVMCTAVQRLGVDAAIIFSDLLPILEPMGMQLEFAPGEGPLIHNPVREPSDVDRVLELESIDPLDFVVGDRAPNAARSARRAAVDRVCRRPIHAGELYDRGRRQPQLPHHQGHDVSPRRRLASVDGASQPRREPLPQRPKFRPEPRPSSCSIRGRAAWVPTTTGGMSCRTSLRSCGRSRAPRSSISPQATRH